MFSSLRHLKDGNGLKLGSPVFNSGNRMKYSIQFFSELIVKTVPTDDQNHIYADPMPKIVYPETYSVLKSSCLQHWFKNWQELRKHKLTTSIFSGAVGFWPQRRVQLWLEKLGAIEPFTVGFWPQRRVQLWLEKLGAIEPFTGAQFIEFFAKLKMGDVAGFGSLGVAAAAYLDRKDQEMLKIAQDGADAINSNLSQLTAIAADVSRIRNEIQPLLEEIVDHLRSIRKKNDEK